MRECDAHHPLKEGRGLDVGGGVVPGVEEGVRCLQGVPTLVTLGDVSVHLQDTGGGGVIQNDFTLPYYTPLAAKYHPLLCTPVNVESSHTQTVDKQTDRQTIRQTDRQTGRQTEIDR